MTAATALWIALVDGGTFLPLYIATQNQQRSDTPIHCHLCCLPQSLVRVLWRRWLENESGDDDNGGKDVDVFVLLHPCQNCRCFGRHFHISIYSKNDILFWENMRVSRFEYFLFKQELKFINFLFYTSSLLYAACFCVKLLCILIIMSNTYFLKVTETMWTDLAYSNADLFKCLN